MSAGGEGCRVLGASPGLESMVCGGVDLPRYGLCPHRHCLWSRGKVSQTSGGASYQYRVLVHQFSSSSGEERYTSLMKGQ